MQSDGLILNSGSISIDAEIASMEIEFDRDDIPQILIDLTSDERAMVEADPFSRA